LISWSVFAMAVKGGPHREGHGTNGPVVELALFGVMIASLSSRP